MSEKVLYLFWGPMEGTEKVTLGIFTSGYLPLTSNSKDNQMGSKKKLSPGGSPSLSLPSPSPCWVRGPPVAP